MPVAASSAYKDADWLTPPLDSLDPGKMDSRVILWSHNLVNPAALQGNVVDTSRINLKFLD